MKDGTERRQPIRNQIDYIITNRKYQSFIINSRSYNNLKTETDHRLVKMTIKLDWYKIKFDTKNEPKYNLGDFNKPNTIKVYKNNIQKKCDNLFTDNMSSQDSGTIYVGHARMLVQKSFKRRKEIKNIKMRP